jgi:hypothetical protein
MSTRRKERAEGDGAVATAVPPQPQHQHGVVPDINNAMIINNNKKLKFIMFYKPNYFLKNLKIQKFKNILYPLIFLMIVNK